MYIMSREKSPPPKKSTETTSQFSLAPSCLLNQSLLFPLFLGAIFRTCVLLHFLKMLTKSNICQIAITHWSQGDYYPLRREKSESNHNNLLVLVLSSKCVLRTTRVTQKVFRFWHLNPTRVKRRTKKRSGILPLSIIFF